MLLLLLELVCNLGLLMTILRGPLCIGLFDDWFVLVLRVPATLTEAGPIVLGFNSKVAAVDHGSRKLAIVVIVLFVLHLVRLVPSLLHPVVDLLDVPKLLHHHTLLLTLPENAVLADLQLA